MKHLQLTIDDFKELLNNFRYWFKQLGYTQTEADNNSSRLKEFLFFLEKNGIQSVVDINITITNEYLQYLSLRPHQKLEGALSLNYQNKHINTLHHLNTYLRLTHLGSYDYLFV